MKLVLIGIQGAGKSTQGNMLAEKFQVPYLSSGHIFRAMAKEESDIGKSLRDTLNAGHLVSDQQTLDIIRQYLMKPEYQKGYILDGFPRTLTQAKAFEKDIDKAIFVDVSDQEALKRISSRVSDRQDETEEAIKKRIELFHEMTEPVIEFYRQDGKLIQVDGEQTVEEVFQSILSGLL